MVAMHSGGCACGAARYKVTGAPVAATVCHCKFCQRRLSSAFAVLAASHGVAHLRKAARHLTIAGGTFDDPSWFAVTRHIRVQSKLPWVTIPEGVESCAQGYLPPAG